jgi:hypothetical protein
MAPLHLSFGACALVSSALVLAGTHNAAFRDQFNQIDRQVAITPYSGGTLEVAPCLAYSCRMTDFLDRTYTQWDVWCELDVLPWITNFRYYIGGCYRYECATMDLKKAVYYKLEFRKSHCSWNDIPKGNMTCPRSTCIDTTP